MPAVKPPFSRPFLVASLPEGGTSVTIEANAAECAALAKADCLVAIGQLEGRFQLAPHRPGNGVTVRGEIAATVTQTCTVTLEPFESEVREYVDLVFMPEEGVAAWMKKRKAQAKRDSDMENEDQPDVIEDGRIDLGELAAEHLALGLDPYPRRPGVEFEASAYLDDKDVSPFAALAKLRNEP